MAPEVGEVVDPTCRPGDEHLVVTAGHGRACSLEDPRKKLEPYESKAASLPSVFLSNKPPKKGLPKKERERTFENGNGESPNVSS